MAFDDALLRIADAPTLRLYGWQPHAVSLGWFQDPAAFADLPPDTPLVRRQTGGGAIHHGDELTFSLAVDQRWLPGDIAASYQLLHDALVAALRHHGVPCERLTAGAIPAARPHDRWCFAVPGRDDIVTAHGKLLGSAQRRVRQPSQRVLHHGSLVLQRPTLTPFCAAVADHVPVDATRREALALTIVEELAAALRLQWHRDAATPAERALAHELTATYATAHRRRS